MTALNQAFIKAYKKDEPHAPVPRPHFVADPNIEVKRQAARETADRIVAEERALAGSQGAHSVGVKPVVPSPQFGPALFEEPGVPESSSTVLGLDDESTPNVTKIPLPQVANLRPSFEVDQVVWPEVCKTLSKEIGDQLDIVVDEFARPRGGGSMSVGIAGIGRQVGCTTVAMTLVRHLCQQRSAAQNSELLLIDANLENPQVANRLGLAPQACWLETLSGTIPLEDTLIESMHDRIVFMPIINDEKSCEKDIDTRKITADLETLAKQHRTVFVDLGALDDADNRSLLETIGGHLDALLLVSDARSKSDSQIEEATERATQAGVEVSGIVENWAVGSSRTTKAA